MILFQKEGRHPPLQATGESIKLTESTLAEPRGGCGALAAAPRISPCASASPGAHAHGDGTPVPGLAKHETRKGRLSASTPFSISSAEASWNYVLMPFVCKIVALQERKSSIGEPMRTATISIIAAAGLMFGVTATFAQNSARENAPGQRMQDKGSVRGQPGASGYAPGQRMQEKGSKPGEPGASGYAPGHQDTTGQGDRGGPGTGTRTR